MLDAALCISDGRRLTPRLLAEAAPTLDPPIAKRVWHLLARFGGTRSS